MPPKVSVVIVFLNGEPYIGEALESVFAQTFTDYELLLVNDGSTDGSEGRAKALARSDPRVRYLEHLGGVNRGVAESRRLGAREARGEFLLYLDHDDVLRPQCVEKLVAMIEPHPAAVAAFATTVFWAFDPALGLEDYTQVFDPLPDGLTDGRSFLRRLLKSEDMHPATCSTLNRTAALRAAQECGEPLKGMYEEAAVLAVLMNAGGVCLLNEPLSAYRMHGKSMCHTAKAEGTHNEDGDSQDRYRYLKWLQKHLVTDLRTRARLEREIMAYEHPKALAALQKVRRLLPV